MLAISYLPTAQRLTINIMKLRDVKFTPAVPSLDKFSKYRSSICRFGFLRQIVSLHSSFSPVDPYVRVLMLNGRTGKKMKKKKTKFLHAVAQPEFNETLTFDLAVTQLDNVQFLVVLCSKVYRTDHSHP